jgi:hypothetical protein
MEGCDRQRNIMHKWLLSPCGASFNAEAPATAHGNAILDLDDLESLLNKRLIVRVATR